MSDVTAQRTTYQPPNFAVTLATSLGRQGLTLASGLLVAHGILPQAQSAQFGQVGLAIILGALSWGWSLYEKKAHAADAARQVRVAVAVAKAS